MENSAPPWTELPVDLTMNILGRLELVEILDGASRVCSTWRKVCKDYPEMWRVITMKNGVALDGLVHCFLSDLWREAVDRSQGQLIELILQDVGDDELLNYVVDRSSKLRSLKLHSCLHIGINCLIEALKELPHLDELHLTYMVFYKAPDIEIIGISCPMLKPFALNGACRSLGQYGPYSSATYECSHKAYALAVAKTMPNLRRLQLIGLLMENEDLEAILDGCPLLESLDLWDCVELDLQGALGIRCSEQIKDLRVPLGKKRNYLSDSDMESSSDGDSCYIDGERIDLLGHNHHMESSFDGDSCYADGEHIDLLCHNDHAQAIEKTTLNLQTVDKKRAHEAVLDGCPHLDYLDLSNCMAVALDLQGAIGKRCFKQIKVPRHPLDVIRYWYEWLEYRL